MIILGDAWQEVKRESVTATQPDGSTTHLEEVTYQRLVSSTIEDLQTKRQELEANLVCVNEVIAAFEKENKEV